MSWKTKYNFNSVNRLFNPPKMQTKKRLYIFTGKTFFLYMVITFYYYLQLPQNQSKLHNNTSEYMVYLNLYLKTPLMLWIWISFRRGELDTILCDKGCQWLATGRWFSPSTPIHPQMKLTATIYNWNIVVSGVKHHNPNNTMSVR